jgi:hypothetical protein
MRGTNVMIYYSASSLLASGGDVAVAIPVMCPKSWSVRVSKYGYVAMPL